MVKRYDTWEDRIDRFQHRLARRFICSWREHDWRPKLYGRLCHRCWVFEQTHYPTTTFVDVAEVPPTDQVHVLLSVTVEDRDHATWECSCGRIGEVTRGRDKNGQFLDSADADEIAAKRFLSHVRLSKRWGT